MIPFSLAFLANLQSFFGGPGGRWTVAMSWAPAFIDTMATSSSEAGCLATASLWAG